MTSPSDDDKLLRINVSISPEEKQPEQKDQSFRPAVPLNAGVVQFRGDRR